MNRRRFIQSLAAVFTVPTGSVFALKPAAAAASSAVAVPKQARFWAIYITGLHGECTPQTLQNMLHIPEVDAKRYIGQLLADGVIKPTPVLQRAVTELAKPREDGLLDKVKKRLEKKHNAGQAEAVKAEATKSEIAKSELGISESAEPIQEPDMEESEAQAVIDDGEPVDSSADAAPEVVPQLLDNGPTDRLSARLGLDRHL